MKLSDIKAHIDKMAELLSPEAVVKSFEELGYEFVSLEKQGFLEYNSSVEFKKDLTKKKVSNFIIEVKETSKEKFDCLLIDSFLHKDIFYDNLDYLTTSAVAA